MLSTGKRHREKRQDGNAGSSVRPWADRGEDRAGAIYFARKEVLVTLHAMTLGQSRCVGFTFAHTSDGTVDLGL